MEGQEHSLDHLREFLRMSDKYLLEDVKIECEIRLRDMTTFENIERILEWAETYNADNLKDYCLWKKSASQSDIESVASSFESSLGLH